MKFKIGDKVKIIKEGYGLFKSSISNINNSNPKIINIEPNKKLGITLKIDNYTFPIFVDEDQIELVNNFKDIKITDVYNELILIRNNIDQLMKKIKNDCLGGKYD